MDSPRRQTVRSTFLSVVPSVRDTCPRQVRGGPQTADNFHGIRMENRRVYVTGEDVRQTSVYEVECTGGSELSEPTLITESQLLSHYLRTLRQVSPLGSSVATIGTYGDPYLSALRGSGCIRGRRRN